VEEAPQVVNFEVPQQDKEPVNAKHEDEEGQWETVEHDP